MNIESKFRSPSFLLHQQILSPFELKERLTVNISIFLCADVGGRIPTFDFRYKKLKILPFMVTNVQKDGTFPAYSWKRFQNT